MTDSVFYAHILIAALTPATPIAAYWMAKVGTSHRRGSSANNVAFVVYLAVAIGVLILQGEISRRIGHFHRFDSFSSAVIGVSWFIALALFWGVMIQNRKKF